MQDVAQCYLGVRKLWLTGRLSSDPTVYRGSPSTVETDPGISIWSEVFEARQGTENTNVGNQQGSSSSSSTSAVADDARAIRKTRAPHCKIALLLPGSNESCMFWPDEFIDRLVALSYCVVRIDNRGFGRSSWCRDFERQPFGIQDMARDAISVLRQRLPGFPENTEELLICGHSMGGMIAQAVGGQLSTSATFPSNVRIRLALLATTPYPATVVENSNDEAAIDARYFKDKEVRDLRTQLEQLGKEADRYWGGGAAFKEMQVVQGKLLRLFHGSGYPFSEAEFAERLDRAIRRGGVNTRCPHLLAMRQHEKGLLMQAFEKASASSVVAAAIVFHGDGDRVIDIQGAHDCATKYSTTKKVELHVLAAAGHRFGPVDWKMIAEKLEAFVNVA
ncbi:unnamed protein product [Amoebophrya sp. A25]|nr:unnamed protein product [Amoebophrya sp. A25]|eukprot:GSA25T00020195001.1